MDKLLVINFLVKLLARKNIFKHIKEKYGHTTVKITRDIENKRTKLTKLKCDLNFLTTCKRNNLIPTFAKPKLAIKMNRRLKQKIAKTIIEDELRNKHRMVNWLKKEVKKRAGELKLIIGFISFCTLNKKINSTIKKKTNNWKTIHQNKLERLFENKNKHSYYGHDRPNNIVHNFFSYELTAEEKHILSFSLYPH